MIKTVGLVAGDEESYELFAELFEPVISARHGGYAKDAVHPTDLDVSKLTDTKIDPTGKYVLTSRCRTGRSVRGFKLPPVTDFEERRKVEALVVKGLLSMEGDLKGDYFPLHGSQSYAPKPNGMSIEKEEELRQAGNLFQVRKTNKLHSRNSFLISKPVF
jgi:creatine kinase